MYLVVSSLWQLTTDLRNRHFFRTPTMDLTTYLTGVVVLYNTADGGGPIFN